MQEMNAYVLLAITLLLGLVYAILRNQYSKNVATRPSDHYSFISLSSLVTAIVLILISGGVCHPSLFTIALGVGFGLLTVIASVSNLLALSIGPMSYTTVIATSSMIIPAMSGQVFWGEPVSVRQYVGIFLILVSLILSVDKEANEKGSSLRWLALCLVCFVATGMVGIAQKIHQSSAYRHELSEFLVIAFVVSTVLSLGVYRIYERRGQASGFISSIRKPGALLLAVATGVCFAVVNQINLYLAGAMESSVFFPIVNGGGLLLATISAIVIFGERLNRKRTYGLVIGLVGVALLL
ncbi:MAG: hypothetical protein WBI38_00985 [Bacillota bacterium]